MASSAFVTVSSAPPALTSRQKFRQSCPQGTLRATAFTPLTPKLQRSVYFPMPQNQMPRRPKTTTETPLIPIMAATEPGKDPTRKQLAQLYGGSYLATSAGLSAISFASFFALVYVGVDVRSLMHGLADLLAMTPLGRPTGIDNISDAASAAAIAYFAHKATSPLRFPITIAATPFVARLFSKKGGGGGGSTDGKQ